MSKFIESEIYGNCDVNNKATINGKIYNDDILYVSFSKIDNGDTPLMDIDLRIHVRRFDNTITKSGYPMVHWWFAISGSDASTNQEPSQVDPNDIVNITYDNGYELDPTPGTSVIASGTDLHTAITDSANDIILHLLGDLADDSSFTGYINAMVQGIVYSEKFTIYFGV